MFSSLSYTFPKTINQLHCQRISIFSLYASNKGTQHRNISRICSHELTCHQKCVERRSSSTDIRNTFCENKSDLCTNLSTSVEYRRNCLTYGAALEKHPDVVLHETQSTCFAHIKEIISDLITDIKALKDDFLTRVVAKNR